MKKTRPVTVLSLCTALLLAGLWAAWRLPVEWTPQVELPQINILADWPGASPRSVEQFVTVPIESAMQGVEGTEEVRSFSMSGRTLLRLSIGRSQDFGLYIAEVNERLAFLQQGLPVGVVPRLTTLSPPGFEGGGEFLRLQLVGTASPDQLRQAAQKTLVPQILRQAGVHRVTLAGGLDQELKITLLPDRLIAYGIHPATVQQSLTAALTEDSYGWIVDGGNTALLRTSAVRTHEALQDLVLATLPSGSPIKLSDLAMVEIQPARRLSFSRVNGQNVITLSLERSPGSDLLAVAGRLHRLLPALNAALPGDARLLVADDRSEAIREQLSDLAVRGGLGVLLLVGVLLALLRSFRALMIILVQVAVSLAGAAILLLAFNLTLNLLTLAGIALVLGFLVDNAIVMVEQLMVERRRCHGSGREASVADEQTRQRALRTVWLPLLGGTLTTLAVLIPLLYLSGDLRRLFVSFGVVVSLTLLISLCTVSVVIPTLGRFLPPAHRSQQSRLRSVLAWPLRMAARYPRSVLMVLLLIHGIPTGLVPQRLSVPEPVGAAGGTTAVRFYNATVGSKAVREVRKVIEPLLGGISWRFFRDVELAAKWDFEPEREINVQITAPPGGSIEHVEPLAEQLEQVALAAPGVRRTLVQGDGREAQLRVQFTEAALATAQPSRVQEQIINQAIRLGGVALTITGLGSGAYFSGVENAAVGIPIEIYGPNFEGVETLTNTLAKQLAQSPGVSVVERYAGRRRSVGTEEILHLRWDGEAVRRTGTSVRRLAETLGTRLGLQAARLELTLADGERLPLRLGIAGGESLDLARLLSEPIRATSGRIVKLEDLAELHIEQQVPLIERTNQQYQRRLNVHFQGPVDLGESIVDHGIEVLPLPPGYRVERPTSVFFNPETRYQLLLVLLATVIVIFLITAAVLESWRLPLIVFASLPLAAVGVATAFLWTGEPLGEGAFLGLVLLVGVVVNNSILLVHSYERLRSTRPDTPSGCLIRLAIRRRLRPMWTTTLSSLAALLPLLIFPGEGRFWFGLALTVAAGLLAATLLVPMAVTALVSLEKPQNFLWFVRRNVKVDSRMTGRELPIGSLKVNTN